MHLILSSLVYTRLFEVSCKFYSNEKLKTDSLPQTILNDMHTDTDPT